MPPRRASKKTGTFSGQPALEHRTRVDTGEEEYMCTVCKQFFPLQELSKRMCRECGQEKREAEAKVREIKQLHARGRANTTAKERGKFAFRKG